MKVQLIRRKNFLLVRLKGELDHHTSLKFRAAVQKELEKDIICNLVLNLEHLTFMDSSGIGVILGRYREIKTRKGKLALCGLNDHIKKILQLGGVLKIIPVYSNEKEAASIMS